MKTEQRRAYVERVKKRYWRANRTQKGRILDELCAVCGYQRKYAIGLLSKKRAGRPKKSRRGRPPLYADKEVVGAIRRIWKGADFPCGKRLKAMLPIWMDYDEKRHGPYGPDTRQKLLSVSAATLDRMLSDERLKGAQKGRSGTKPGSLLREQIPIRAGVWDESEPGYVEADTVAHCGTSMAGDFVWSLTITDICTTWTEVRAVWNKGALGVIDAIKDVERALPFTLLGFDCDNGSEFLNNHLLRYFQEHKYQPNMTRSRPYRKNDNAHVEQKNWSHVRQLVGYDRFDNKDILPLLNNLYKNEFALYRNFFIPTFKLKAKRRVGSKVRRNYGTPRTAYQRVMDSQNVSDEQKERLRQLYSSLDPFLLRSDILAQLKTINRLAKVSSKPRVPI